MTQIRFSHYDVLTAGVDAGLSWDDAEDIAFRLCPEYRTTTLGKAMNAIAARMKEVGIMSDPSGKVKP